MSGKICLCGEKINNDQPACPECLVDMDIVGDILDEAFLNKKNKEDREKTK